MPNSRPQTTLMLWAAFAMPLLYFGVQLMAAPFYPGYHFATDTASMLGTSVSRHPGIFNIGAILTGIAGLAGAFGLFLGLRGATAGWLRIHRDRAAFQWSNVSQSWALSNARPATCNMAIPALPGPDYAIATSRRHLAGPLAQNLSTAGCYLPALALTLYDASDGAYPVRRNDATTLCCCNVRASRCCRSCIVAGTCILRQLDVKHGRRNS